jgi:hypothetical protein
MRKTERYIQNGIDALEEFKMMNLEIVNAFM